MHIPSNANDYFKQICKPYQSKPAQSGNQDKSLLSLCTKLNLNNNKLVLDFGCGKGRLLSAILHTKQPYEIANLHYIGVDQDRESLRYCKDYFVSNCEPLNAKGSFLDFDNFKFGAFLADYIIIVFTVHELDTLNLDMILANLWRMLRRGGTLIIIDTTIPIYEEIEFICFTPDELKIIFQYTKAIIDNDKIICGTRKIPVYIFRANKPLTMKMNDAYSPSILNLFTDSFKEAVHHAILKECREFYDIRNNIDEGKSTNTANIAMICHRIASKARAYHHVHAFHEVEVENKKYCLSCGCTDVSEHIIPFNIKDPGHRKIICNICGYIHEHIIEPGVSHMKYDIRDLLCYLDGDIKRGDTFNNIQIKLFKELNYNIMHTVEFMLENIK